MILVLVIGAMTTACATTETRKVASVGEKKSTHSQVTQPDREVISRGFRR